MLYAVETMSQPVTNYVLSALEDDASVDREVLLTALFLVEKWKKNLICGPDEELADLLEKETFDDDSMELIRQQLIGFAGRTESPQHFAGAVGVLSLYHDERDTPLFQAWLLEKSDLLLMQNLAVWSLFNALQTRGEKITERRSLSTSGIDENLADIRSYLDAVYGIKLPW